MRPLHIVVRSPRRPADPASPHISSCPEESLTLPGHQPFKLRLLVAGVQTHCSHAIGSTEGDPLALGEVRTSNPPAEQIVLAPVLIVGSVASTTPSTRGVGAKGGSCLASGSAVTKEATKDVSKESKLRHGSGQREEREKSHQ